MGERCEVEEMRQGRRWPTAGNCGLDLEELFQRAKRKGLGFSYNWKAGKGASMPRVRHYKDIFCILLEDITYLFHLSHMI